MNKTALPNKIIEIESLNHSLRYNEFGFIRSSKANNWKIISISAKNTVDKLCIYIGWCDSKLFSLYFIVIRTLWKNLGIGERPHREPFYNDYSVDINVCIFCAHQQMFFILYYIIHFPLFPLSKLKATEFSIFSTFFS